MRFLGYRRDLTTIASAADIAVLTSARGTPVSLIEAAAAGLPAVATRVGGVPGRRRHGDRHPRSPDDPEAAAAALRRLASDRDLRARLGEAARERALSRYPASRLVADIDALYGELLAPRRPLAE